ncbi:MAG: hypothetical protein ACXVDA_04065 [Ktedonobacterales bacterium]
MKQEPEYQTIRIWTRTLKNLRLVAALRGERMVQVLDRIVRQELERVQRESDAEGPSDGKERS